MMGHDKGVGPKHPYTMVKNYPEGVAREKKRKRVNASKWVLGNLIGRKKGIGGLPKRKKKGEMGRRTVLNESRRKDV